MTDTEIKDKIAETLKKCSIVHSWLLSGEYILAENCPEGAETYYKKRIFEIKKELNNGSVIGRTWVENGCRNDLQHSDWLFTIMEFLVKLGNEKGVFESLELFMNDYFLIQELSNFQNSQMEAVRNNFEPKQQPKFADYLINIENKKKFISELKKKFPSGKNSEAAIMITALIESNFMAEPENEIDYINAIKKEWESDFIDETYYKARRKIHNRITIDKKSHSEKVIEAINIVKSCYLVGTTKIQP
jgi:hypothetical protein